MGKQDTACLTLPGIFMPSPREERVEPWHHEGQRCGGPDHSCDHHHELHAPPPKRLWAINYLEAAKFLGSPFTI
jgi:hypothetical protein